MNTKIKSKKTWWVFEKILNIFQDNFGKIWTNFSKTYEENLIQFWSNL